MRISIKSYISTIIIAFVVSLICNSIAMGLIRNFGIDCTSDHFLLLYGGYFFDDDILFPYMIFIIPTLIQLLLYGGILMSDYSIVSTYAFTRSLSRITWYSERFLKVLVLLTLFTFSSLSFVFIYRLIFDIKIGNINIIIMTIIYILATSFLWNLLIIWGCNILLLYLKTSMSMFVSIFISLVGVYWGCIGNTSPWNIMNHVFVLRHDFLFVNNQELLNRVIPENSIFTSFIILISLVILEFCIGFRLISKKDLFWE